MSFFRPIDESACLFDKKTLVVPIVSTANVGQLAVDILIASLGFRRVGIFNSRDIIPVVGGREVTEDEEGVTTPLELYGKAGGAVFFLQQRSPAIKSRKESFISSLLSFVKESNFGAVLFLSGCDLTNRTDAQMFTPIYTIQPPNTPPLDDSLLSRFVQVPRYTFSNTVSQDFQPALPMPSDTTNSVIPFIPGGGLTRRILTTISQTADWTVPVVSIVQFVVEGDNRGDAVLAASAVSQLLLDPPISNFKQPGSWTQGLFGTPHDQSLFG